jgi:hypothetical protein
MKLVFAYAFYFIALLKADDAAARVQRPEWGNNVIAQGKAKRRPGLLGKHGSSP